MDQANIEQWHIKKPVVCSKNGVVAAQHQLAADKGAEILANGGNAVDAAVATAFALGCVEPWMCGLGGSGLMVIWLANEQRAVTIDFQGVLPAKIDPNDYPIDPSVPDTIMGFPGVVDQRNVVGGLAVLVPGALKGLDHALKHYGTMPLGETMAPAIELADTGMPVDWFTTLQISLAAKDLASNAAAARLFLPNGAPPEPGQYLRLGKLPETLKCIQHAGADAFYNGEVASSIANDLRSLGSRIENSDLVS